MITQKLHELFLYSTLSKRGLYGFWVKVGFQYKPFLCLVHGNVLIYSKLVKHFFFEWKLVMVCYWIIRNLANNVFSLSECWSLSLYVGQAVAEPPGSECGNVGKRLSVKVCSMVMVFSLSTIHHCVMCFFQFFGTCEKESVCNWFWSFLDPARNKVIVICTAYCSVLVLGV